MHLPNAGEEYARILFSDLPDGAAVEVSVDDQETWHLAEPGTVPNEVRILLRGPAAPSTDGLLVALQSRLWVRVTDSPELVIRDAGIIVVR